MTMKTEKDHTEEADVKLAAVCGLYCEGCSWFIATAEDPARLKRLASQMNFTEEESKCYGCRSAKRLAYCGKCKMFACASGLGIEFCSECKDYPCNDLKEFQSAMPHRIELWDNLERIKAAGYEQWLKEIRGHYACPRCQALNSSYDLKCRRCGGEPSCSYVAEHRDEIEQFLKDRNA